MLTRDDLAATIASMQWTVSAFSGACPEFQPSAKLAGSLNLRGTNTMLNMATINSVS